LAFLADGNLKILFNIIVKRIDYLLNSRQKYKFFSFKDSHYLFILRENVPTRHHIKDSHFLEKNFQAKTVFSLLFGCFPIEHKELFKMAFFFDLQLETLFLSHN